MGALKDILKVSIWGLLLLALVIFVSTTTAEYKNTNIVINKVLVDLEPYQHNTLARLSEN